MLELVAEDDDVRAFRVAHELGQKLGCGAHLATLRRSASGRFDVSEAIKLDDLLKLSLAEVQQRVIPFLKLSTME